MIAIDLIPGLNYDGTSALDAGDLDLELYNANHSLVAQSSGGGGTELISLAGLPAGSYFLKVNGFYGATNWYGLRYDIETIDNRIPILTSPPSLTTDPSPTFSWTSAVNAASYEIWVNRVGASDPAIHLGNLSGTSYTPTQNLAAGSYQVRVRGIASNGVANPWSLNQTFTIINIVPIANAGHDRILTNDSVANVTLTGSFTDGTPNDTHTLLWDFVSGPAGVTLPAVSGQLSYSFTAQTPGVYTFNFTVTDGFGDSDTDTVTVSLVNVAPAVHAGNDMTVPNSQNSVQLLAGFADLSRNDSLTLLWRLESGPADVTLPDGASSLYSFAPRVPGNYTFRFSATDSYNANASDTVVITVHNVVPVANAGPDQTVSENTPVSLTGSFSDATIGDAHTLLWHLVSGPAGQSVPDSTSANLNFTPEDDGTFTFHFTVTDCYGASHTDTVVVNVTNLAPTLFNVFGPIEAVEGQFHNYNFFASDPSPEDERHGFFYEIDWDNDGTIDQTSIASSATSNVFPHIFATAGDHTFKVRARDKDGAVSDWRSHTVPVVRLTAQHGVRMGSEFRVNTTTSGDQKAPAVAMDADGDFVVVWGAANDAGIFGQRYDKTGQRVGGEFRVSNTVLTGVQRDPAVAMDDDGDFVVVWMDYGRDGNDYGIYAQRFDNLGQALGTDFLVNTNTAGRQDEPAIAMDPNGNFVIAWTNRDNAADGNGSSIWGQRYFNTGAANGGNVRANSFTFGQQQHTGVAMNAGGEYIIVWQDPSGGDPSWAALEGKRYTATGDVPGAADYLLYNFNEGTGIQQTPVVGLSDAGLAAYVYASEVNGDGVGNDFDIFSSRGGPRVQVNTYTAGVQQAPALAMMPDGTYVVVWDSFGQDGSQTGVYGRMLGPDGQPLTPEFQINTHTANYQGEQAVAIDNQGNFVVVWSSFEQDGHSSGIYAQRFGPNFRPTVDNLPHFIVQEDHGFVPFELSRFFDDAEDGEAGLTYSIVDTTTADPLFENIHVNGRWLEMTSRLNVNGFGIVVVRATDSNGASLDAAFRLTVDPRPDAPFAVGESVTIAEDEVRAITLQAGDPDGPASVIIVSLPDHGVLYDGVNTGVGARILQVGDTLNDVQKRVTYVPTPNYHGSDDFTIKGSDGTTDSATASIDITITPVDDAPVAQAKVISASEDLQVISSVLATDADSAPITYSKQSDPAHGDLVFNSDGTFIYVPNANFNGVDIFTYRASAGGLDSQTVTVTINVAAVNDAPELQQASRITRPNTGFDIDLRTLVSDVETTIDAITFDVLDALNGTVELLADGHTVRFTPAANYRGDAWFTWSATDTGDNGDDPITAGPETVVIIVAGLHQSVAENSLVVLDAASLNPAIDEAHALRWRLLSSTNGQSVPDANDRILSFVPADNGIYRFEFTNQTTGYSDLAIVEVSNVAPVLANIYGPVQSVVGNVRGFRFEVTDASRVDYLDTFTFEIDWNGDGTVDETAGRSVSHPVVEHTFTTAGDHTVKVRAFDKDGGASEWLTVTVPVLPAVQGANNTPTARDFQFVQLAEDFGFIQFDLAYFFSDVEDDATLTYSIVDASTAAALVTTSIAGNWLQLTTFANAHGFGTIIVRAVDTQGATLDSALRLTLTPQDDTGSAVGDSLTVPEDGSGAVTLQGNDPDGPVTFIIASLPEHGILYDGTDTGPSGRVLQVGDTLLDAQRQVTFVPAVNFAGNDAFSFKVNDGVSNSAPATVTIMVTPFDDAPSAQSQSISTSEDVQAAGSVLAVDPEDAALTYSKYSDPLHGDLVFNSDGTFTYVPDANFNGQDSFQFKANDGGLDSNIATVTINVAAVNDAATALGASLDTNEDSAVDIDLRTLVSDLETTSADGFVFSVGTAVNGIATLLADGHTARFTPAANFNGAASFSYTVTDAGDNGAAPISVGPTSIFIDVAAVNDAPVAVNANLDASRNAFADIDLRIFASDIETPDDDLFFIVASAVNGSVMLQADGHTARFTPTAEFTGPASFRWSTSDTGTGGAAGRTSGLATVNLNLLPVNAALPFTDAFNRNGSPFLGAAWSEKVGDFTLTESALATQKSNIGVLAGVLASDVVVNAEVNVSSAAQAGVIVRYSTDGRNMYWAGLNNKRGVITAVIYRVVKGKAKLLASQRVSEASGNVRFEIAGNAMKLHFKPSTAANFVLATFAYDSLVAAPGTVGLNGTANSTFDNFAAEVRPTPDVGLPFADALNGNNGAQLSDAWRHLAGNFSLQDNRLHVSASSINLALLRGIAVNDVVITANVDVSVRSAFASVAARSDASGQNMYFAGLQNSRGKISAVIYRVLNGRLTRLASVRVVDATAMIRFEVQGSSLKLFVQDAVSGDFNLVALALDSRIVTPGTIGLRGTANAVFDSLSAQEWQD